MSQHASDAQKNEQVVADLADLNVGGVTEVDEEMELGAEAMAQVTQLQADLATAKAHLQAATEREKRVLADYQNLVRRSQEDRVRVAKLAGAEFVSVLLQPLDHLSRAAAQLKDKGLDMVVSQFWQVLGEVGLQEIPVMGKKFDVTTMEAIERKGAGEKVMAVASKGFTLNGEVIQHAKVVLG